MADEDYAVLLDKAKKERADLGVERGALEKRVAQLDSIIMALRTLVERPKIDPAKGLTEGIKSALKMSHPMGNYPLTIRAQLEKAGFDFSKQSNVMASIHAILKRLEKAGIVKAVQKDDTRGSTFYVWISDEDRKKGEEAKKAVEDAKAKSEKAAQVNAALLAALKAAGGKK